MVGSAADGEDLVRKARAHEPDVVVADIRMPPTQTDEGLRAAIDIRESKPGVIKHVSHIYDELGLDPCPHDHRRVLAVLRFLEG